MVQNPSANAGDAIDTGSTSESERSPGGGNGNPLQYSCMGNPIDRGAWQAGAVAGAGASAAWGQAVAGPCLWTAGFGGDCLALVY